MYVILKGKISVKISVPNRANVQLLIAMPSDGECFGELAAFDFNKIESKAVNVKNLDNTKTTKSI